MTEQYRMGILIEEFLEKLNIHSVTVTEAMSDENYRKSYQIITDNPQITKEDFLEAMGLEEYRY